MKKKAMITKILLITCMLILSGCAKNDESKRNEKDNSDLREGNDLSDDNTEKEDGQDDSEDENDIPIKQDVDYGPYRVLIENYEAEYGVLDVLMENGCYNAYGIVYLDLIDFNNDGIDELVLVKSPMHGAEIYMRDHAPMVEVWSTDGHRLKKLLGDVLTMCGDDSEEYKIELTEVNGTKYLLTGEDLYGTIRDCYSYYNGEMVVAKSIDKECEYVDEGITYKYYIDDVEVDEEEYNNASEIYNSNMTSISISRSLDENIEVTLANKIKEVKDVVYQYDVVENINKYNDPSVNKEYPHKDVMIEELKEEMIAQGYGDYTDSINEEEVYSTSDYLSVNLTAPTNKEDIYIYTIMEENIVNEFGYISFVFVTDVETDEIIGKSLVKDLLVTGLMKNADGSDILIMCVCNTSGQDGLLKLLYNDEQFVIIEEEEFCMWPYEVMDIAEDDVLKLIDNEVQIVEKVENGEYYDIVVKEALIWNPKLEMYIDEEWMNLTLSRGVKYEDIDFLSDEQKMLHEQLVLLRQMGDVYGQIDILESHGIKSYDNEMTDDYGFLYSNIKYEDYKNMYLDVITEDVFNNKNGDEYYSTVVANEEGNLISYYIQADGASADLPYRDGYELQYMSDDMVVYQLVRYRGSNESMYAQGNIEDVNPVRTQAYQFVMIKTEEGWRFDKYEFPYYLSF